jgi:predicted RNase H-like HicB family nuclease
MKTYKLIVEKNKDGYWSQIEKIPSIFGSGESIAELMENTKEAVELYFEVKEDEVKEDEVPKFKFELVMDIQEFFKINEYINITSLAKRIGMNSSLLRQYSKGIKYPSLNQVAKIEIEIKQIAKELSKTELQPA